MSRIRLSACRPGAGNAGLGLSFAGCDRPSGVWARPMSGLDRSIDAPVHFSTLIDGAAEFCKVFADVADGHRQPMTRSTSVECRSSAVAGSMTGIVWIIGVHRTRSRDHFRGSQLHARRRSAQGSSSQTPGQCWPERLRSHLETLLTRYRTYLGKV